MIRLQYILLVKILPSNQKRVIEQAKFTYSPLEKAFEKQIIMEKKQVEAFKDNKEKQIHNANDYKKNY